MVDPPRKRNATPRAGDARRKGSQPSKASETSGGATAPKAPGKPRKAGQSGKSGKSGKSGQSTAGPPGRDGRVPAGKASRAGAGAEELLPQAPPPQTGAARRSRAAKGSAPERGESGKYVYCIIANESPASFGTIGIGAEPTEVHTVGYEDIAAVVSDTPIEVYDPTRENVLAHERVNETVMLDYTVIPMSFGTVFKTAEDIVELLRSAYAAFRDVLQKMENKLEFGLKVLWDPDEIVRVVEKEDDSLRRLREEILKQRGSTYFARMQYGRLVDSLLQDRSEFYNREIFEALRPVAVASRANKPIGERMIMNGAFLVSRDLEHEFDAAVKALGSRYPHLTFKYTGPWPPYNFVNIRLKLERAKELE